MRIIKRARLREFWARYPEAEGALESWMKLAKAAAWRSLVDVRHSYPSADGVLVKGGRVATVFNIHGNRYRLITVIHYNRGIVYIRDFLTHDEYDRGKWKERL
jgi:mRNA interferase HigB